MFKISQHTILSGLSIRNQTYAHHQKTRFEELRGVGCYVVENNGECRADTWFAINIDF